MLYNLILWLTLGAAFALVACTYSAILTQPEMLFNPLYNWLDKKLGPSSRPKDALGPYSTPRAMWLFKLLIGCPRCVAGQAGVWLFLLCVLSEPLKYSFFGHLLATAASIFFVNFFQKAYNWSRKS